MRKITGGVLGLLVGGAIGTAIGGPVVVVTAAALGGLLGFYSATRLEPLTPRRRRP